MASSLDLRTANVRNKPYWIVDDRALSGHNNGHAQVRVCTRLRISGDPRMARSLNKLNVRQVAAAKMPGRYSDGGGLYLRVTTSGSRSWVFMAAEGGKRQEIGLGSVNAVPLATARQLATAMREAKALGNDPREVIAPAIKPESDSIPTFGTFAEEYIASVEAGWRNPVHRQQWRSSLRDHAALLRDIRIDEVDTEQLLLVLRPIW